MDKNLYQIQLKRMNILPEKQDFQKHFCVSLI